MPVRGKIFGDKLIVDFFSGHGHRKSPKPNKRAEAAGRCARAVGKGKDKEKKLKRKACFAVKDPTNEDQRKKWIEETKKMAE